MTVYEAIMNRRTIRKFTDEKVDHKLLTRLVDCARMAAYGANMQPLKFAVIDRTELLERIFPCTKWAGYLEDGAPKENERPAAYIAVLGDKTLRPSGAFEVEAGAAVTTMMLAAQEMDLASCWLGAINREEICRLLRLPEHFDVVYLLALGYPKQESYACEIKNEDIKYYRDSEGVIHVPKRSLEEVLVEV